MRKFIEFISRFFKCPLAVSQFLGQIDSVDLAFAGSLFGAATWLNM